MKDLIPALTRAANAVALYYEKAAGGVVTAPAPTGAVVTEEAAPKPRKARTAAAAPALPPTPAPAAAAAAPMPEGLDAPAPVVAAAAAPAPALADGEIPENKSLAALYEAGAKVVERFKNSKPTGFERATEHMKTTYKVARMQDLPHAQRLQFIGWLKTELEKPA